MTFIKFSANVILYLNQKSKFKFQPKERKVEMANKNGPYVGVTGFMSCNEVREALTMVPKKSVRRLMVGILMSSKTLAGQTNKWPGRYPKKEAVAGIFADDERALNLVHYNTDNPETLFAQLTEITELAGPHLDGFQLNIAWPPIAQVQKYRKTNPEKFLLLQIGGKAMAVAGSAKHFAELVGEYLPTIDAILIDPSGGKGQPLDPIKGTEYLSSLHNYPKLGLGIAGGLGSRSLYLIDPLVRMFPNLSIDAEGQLRTRPPEDKLCIYTMKNYLEDAFPILAGQK